jgi:hypothetical protein
VGVLTTVLVIIAWSVNLFLKPDATKFGGGLTALGLIAGLLTYRYSRSRRPAEGLFPRAPGTSSSSFRMSSSRPRR